MSSKLTNNDNAISHLLRGNTYTTISPRLLINDFTLRENIQQLKHEDQIFSETPLKNRNVYLELMHSDKAFNILQQIKIWIMQHLRRIHYKLIRIFQSGGL